MLGPNDIEELKGNNSRYAVVVGVAKRARQIADEAEENKEILVEKTVRPSRISRQGTAPCS